MKQAPSSTLAFFRHFVRTCTGQPTAANPGQSCKPTDSRGGGDKQWFTIDKTGGPGHGFQYQSSDGANCSGSGVNSNARPTAGSPGRPQSLFHSEPTDGTLDVDTNGNLFIGGEGNNIFYCVRSSNAQIGNQTPTFDQVTQHVNMGGDLSGGGINPGRTGWNVVPGD